MPSSLFPEPYKKILIESLTDKDHPAYGQVATVDLSGNPQVRTVHLRYLTDNDIFAFSTNTQSPKWMQLRERPSLAGCYFDQQRQIQFRWGSAVELVEGTDQEKNYLTKKMWHLIRVPIRTAYWLEAKGIPKEKWYKVALNVLQQAPNFGVVLLKPNRWDILEISPEDVSKAKRTFFELSHDKWNANEVSLVTTKDI